MSAEADRFATLLGSDGHHFSALTYQTLWRRLESSLDRQHGVYRDYIRGRYFGVPVV
jgi:hypothetical protein